jgi:hypothetical protein
MSIKRLILEFDSAEIGEWKAYDRLFPLDHAGRADANVGRIIAAILKGGKSSDFYRDYAEEWRQALMPVPVQSPEQLVAKIDAILGAMR